MSVNYVKSTLAEIQNNEKTDRSVNLLKLWRNCEFGTAFFAVISVFISTIDYETNFSPYRDYHNCNLEYRTDQHLRWISLGCSLAAVVFVMASSYAQYQWEDYLLITDETCKFVKTKRFFIKPLLEVAILIVFPYPYMDLEIYEPYGLNTHYIDICYNLVELIYSIMWLRFYFLVKIILDFSPYVGHVARRATIENRVKYGIVFAFKCMFKSNPMFMIIFTIGFPSIIAAGMMTRVYERPLIKLSKQDWENPIIAIWFSYSSMMLGVYGDFYPLSFLGRTTNVVSYLIGTLFFVLIFVNMENQTYLSRKQRKAFNDIELIPSAANLIKASIRYYISSNIGGLSKKKALDELNKRLLKFRYKRKYLLDMPRQRDLDMIVLMRRFRKQKKNMDRIYRKIEEVVHLINKKKSLV